MLVLGAVWSCQSGKKADTVFVLINTDTFVFKREGPAALIKKDANLKCSVDVSYPQLSGRNDSVIFKINTFIANLPVKGVLDLTNEFEKGNTPKNLEEAATAFFAAFEKQYRKSPGTTDIGCFYEAFGKIELNTEHVISLSFNESFYLGGIHPNDYKSYYNFDTNTGRLLRLTDIVKDTVAFLKTAELKFWGNEIKNAKKNNMEFSRGDYFFSENKFILPQNIGITKEGLRLLYNPYEVAAYARGMIILDIPWQELKGIVVEKYAGK